MSRIEIDVDMLLKMLSEKNVAEPVVAPKEEKKEEPVVRPKRCQNDGCKVKLMLSDFACKCKEFYCSQHRFSESHMCSFDYRGVGKELLTKQMPTVAGSKLDRV
jgi:hypothetical protein